MKKLTTICGVIVFASFILASCSSSPVEEKAVAVQEPTIVKKEEIPAPEKEVPLSEKKKIIMNLIGEHNLKSISGAMGANAMFDYSIEKGKWKASGSSISDGMRESYDIDLAKEELVKLKSMKIRVGEDLSLSVLCKGKEYFNTPFDEEGMSYFLKKSPKDYSSFMSEKLKSSTTMLDDNLYFYAKDRGAKSDIDNINVAEIEPDVVVLTYNVKTNEFEMKLFYGECCDNATYIFK